MNVFVNQNYYLHRRPCYMSVICSADPRFSYIRNVKSTAVPTFIVLGFPDLPFTLTVQNMSKGGCPENGQWESENGTENTGRPSE